jgi:hypothetical protein
MDYPFQVLFFSDPKLLHALFMSSKTLHHIPAEVLLDNHPENSDVTGISGVIMGHYTLKP